MELAFTRVLLVARFHGPRQAYVRLIRRALERLGCTVSAFDLEANPGLLARLRGGGDSGERLRRSLERELPELVLVLGAEDLDPNSVRQLRRNSHALWVNWWPGDIRTASQIARVGPAYDHVAVIGTDIAARLDRESPHMAEYLPFASDPSIHKPMRARDQFRANVVFAGMATPRRERFLLDLVEFGLAVWGPGWRRSALRDYCRGEELGPDDYVRAYAGATVAVNIHRHADQEPALDEKSCNRRVFEIAAIGSLQVVDFRGDLHRHFEDGQELLVFRSPGQLKALVREALLDRTRSDVIAQAGRRRALRQHTYMHRVQELLARLSGALR